MKGISDLMYSVVLHTTKSNVDKGTTIPSTKELKEFVCSLDLHTVTHLEITYYRELTPADTGALRMVTKDDSPNGLK